MGPAAAFGLMASFATVSAATLHLQDVQQFNSNISPTSIPELSAALLGGVGVLLLLCARRNR